MEKDHTYRLFFDQLMQKSEDGFILIDQDGIILDINEQYSQFLGKMREKIIGHPIGEIISTTSMYDVLKNKHEDNKKDDVYIKSYIAGETYDINQSYAIGNRFCIFDENNQLIGAMAQMKFKERAMDIADTVMKAELDFYKHAYNQDLDIGSFNSYIGNHPKIEELKRLGSKVAKKDFSVLITGETGTGKEVIAKAIHMESPRHDQPFISINCGAIPSELLESELFGYEDGAFTGAKKGGRLGKFQLANHGTLFLDEIGDLPLQMQVKLLRVLQEQEVEPIGSTKPTPIDVRVISATRLNLQDMMAENQFRSDLYYRLAVINIETVPLREHSDDVILYASNYLNELNKKYHTTVVFSPSIINYLKKYSWPGNVRELQNVIASAYASSDPEQMTITLSDLPSKIVFKPDAADLSSLNQEKKLHTLMQHYETSIIIESLNSNHHNIAATAQELGVERSLLYKKMKKLGIQIQH